MMRNLFLMTLAGMLVICGTALAQNSAAGGTRESDRGAADRDLQNLREDGPAEPGTPGNPAAGHADAEKGKDGMGPMSAEKVLNFVHHDNRKEIKLGQMAQEKAQRQEVKAFGQTLVTDHQKADEKVKQVAKQEGIELKEMMPMKDGDNANAGADDKPDAYDKNAAAGEKKMDAGKKQPEMMKEKAKMEELSNASGAEFDQKFLDMAVKGHTKAIEKLQMTQEKIDSQPVKKLISELLPTLQKHLQTAQQLGGRADTQR